MSELLVTLSMTFPTVDREALADHIAPVLRAAIAAGGNHTSVGIQPYEDEADD